MTKSVLAIILFSLFFALQIQAKHQPAKNLHGIIYDAETKMPIEGAGIRVSRVRPAKYIEGTVSNSKGYFGLNLAPGVYKIRITFIGYVEQSFTVNTTKTPVKNLGNIYLQTNAMALKGATVVGKATEIKVKGDTIEYNAGSYKPKENDMLEDLIKKIPGADIDDNGKITINGKEVQKILIDGEEFFTNDPTVASKNLPAKIIDKLQVFDKKSDMSEMTGFDDGDEETVINLTVKPKMKQGAFGNFYAGYGTQGRYETHGIASMMHNNTQITVIGGANNTNNAGFSDFSSSMFNSNRPRGLNFGGKNGVAKTVNGGLDIAHKGSDKFKFNGDIHYGSIDNDVISTISKRYTGTDRNELTNATGNNTSGNLNSNFRFEWRPDAKTRILFRPTLQYNTNSTFQNSENQTSFGDNQLKNYSTQSKYNSNGHSLKFAGNLSISRQLSSKGRVLSFNFQGGYNHATSKGYNYSAMSFDDKAKQDSLMLDQHFNQEDEGKNWKAYMSYVEPLGRNNFLQLTYRFSENRTNTDKNAFSKDPDTGEYTQIDSLYTRNVNNDFINQNVSLNFKAMRKHYNYTLGMGLEPSSTRTDISQPNTTITVVPKRNYLNVVPKARFNYLWNKHKNLRIDYHGVTNQPTTLQLYNGITSFDGTNEVRGNANLRPSFTNKVMLRYQDFDPVHQSAMLLFGHFTNTMNDIVSVSQWNGNKQQTTYQNINGNLNANLRFIVNRPLRNKKFSINSMTYSAYTINNSFVNSIKNKENEFDLKESAGMQYHSDLFDFTLRGNLAYQNIKNTVQNNNDGNTYNYGGYGSVTLYLPWDFMIDTDMQYSGNAGYTNGFKQNEWLWNASVSKSVFKNKAGLIRFKIYDILHQRSNITRTATTDYIQDITTNTINSYCMLSFIYKFQFFKGGIKRGDMQQNMFGGRRGFGGRHHRMM